MARSIVSIVIPTYNEENNIGRLLDSINKQSYPEIETIVVDSSIDRTANISRKKGAKVIRFKNKTERSVQRNVGAKSSKGMYLLFIDADMELTRNVVKDCVVLVRNNSKIGAVVIPETSIADSFWGKVKAYERSFYNIEGDNSIEAARFFTREAFYKVGGYDEKITGPEDWDLPESIKNEGFKQERVSSKIRHYENVPNPIRLAQKKYYYALRSDSYLKKHKISPISVKTIYFLRPVFYKNWRILLRNPLMTIAMFIMFIFEMFGGGLGYLVGRFRKQ